MFGRSQGIQRPRQASIATSDPSAGRPGRAAYLWGVAGVLALLVKAAISLGGRGLETLRAGLGPGHLAVLLLLTAVFVYGEGHRALQRKWVPHVVRRLETLRARGTLTERILAPLYGMSLVGAPARMVTRAWLGVAAIIVAVLVVRAFPEPWRGIVDFAVAAALAWGSLALLAQGWRAFRGSGLPRPVDG